MSNFEIAITPLIFELERGTKSQNVGNGMAYLAVGLSFGTTSGLKTRPNAKMAVISKISKYLR